MCFSIWAGCHDKALEMRGLRNRNLILTVSEAASLRPRCSHGQFLVKTHFLACQRPPSLCLPRAFPWYMLMGRGRELPLHSFTIPSSCRTILEPHARHPTRLPHPWDSPGNNTGVGCHFLPQCMKVKSESEVAQSYPTPWTAAYRAPPSMGFVKDSQLPSQVIAEILL